MAIEKKTTNKTVKKADAAKPAAVKPAAAVKPVAAVKPAAPKAAAVKPVAPKVAAVAKKTTVDPERFYAMVSEAAYFSAQNDDNKKGAAEYWVEAEAAVRAKFNVA